MNPAPEDRVFRLLPHGALHATLMAKDSYLLRNRISINDVCQALLRLIHERHRIELNRLGITEPALNLTSQQEITIWTESERDVLAPIFDTAWEHTCILEMVSLLLADADFAQVDLANRRDE